MASVDDNVTVIGSSVRVQGNLSGDEDLHVLGRVEGSIELDRTLVVAESGVVKAEVSVRNAVVSGVVVGNIHATESVEITQEGRMVGDISSPRVIIVDGASFRGNVDMGDIENMPQRAPRSEKPRPAPTPRATPVTRAEPAPEPVVDEAPVEEEKTVEAPAPAAAPKRTTIKTGGGGGGGGGIGTKKPRFLDPPKAKGLPKKKKKRVVVKRKKR